MTKCAEVIKRDNIVVEGSFSLNPGGAVSAQPQTSHHPASSAQLSAGQARIVENKADGVVIEVTCACGGKTLIECTY